MDLRVLVEGLLVSPRALPEPVDLLESKHYHTHRGAPHRTSFVKRHHQQFTSALKRRKEELQTRDARVANLASQGIVDDLKRDLSRDLQAVEQAMARSRDPDLSSEQRRQAAMQLQTHKSRIKDRIRASYQAQYRAGVYAKGIGPRFAHASRFSDEERRWVDSAWKHEMRFMNRLFRDLEGGRKAQSLKWRLDQYGRASRGLYWAGATAASDEDTIIWWELDPDCDNCQACVRLSAEGPYHKETLPTTPGAGMTDCVVDPGALVWTSRGRVSIADVRVGDFVWTHRGRLRRVTATQVRPALEPREIVEVGGVHVTADHKVFTWDGWQPLRSAITQELRMIHPQQSEPLLKMLGPAAFGPAHADVPTLRDCLSNLRVKEDAGRRMSVLWDESQDEDVVEEVASEDAVGFALGWVGEVQVLGGSDLRLIHDQEVGWSGDLPCFDGHAREALFSGMLPSGTPLRDLTVEEDESFIVGDGVILQNCRGNCHCELRFETVEWDTALAVKHGGRSGESVARSVRRNQRVRSKR